MTKPTFTKKNITNEEINALPLDAFSGEIVVVEDARSFPDVFSEISEHGVAGFDTETKPVFVSGQLNQVALMQIALQEKVFLIRLNKTGLQQEILHFLESENVLKVGVALRDDIKALQRLKKFEPHGVVELADLAKRASLEVEGVKRLTAILLGFRISKSSQTSNWESPILNEKQISYAATDAWVCLQIFKKLKSYW